MTNTCLAKRGFFTLRGCNRPSMKLCEQCQKPTCQQHLSMRTGNKFCLDCAAKQSQQTGSVQDDDWTHSYRNWYYLSYGYNPYGYGHRDYTSFSSTGEDYDNIDDNDAGDFSDS